MAGLGLPGAEGGLSVAGADRAPVSDQDRLVVTVAPLVLAVVQVASTIDEEPLEEQGDHY